MEEQLARTISLREIRNVPETINATIDFIRLHRRRLGKLVLTRAFPLLVLGQIIYGYLTFGVLLDPYGDGYTSRILFLLVVIVSYVIGYTLLIGIVFSYVRLAETYEEDEFDADDVWEQTKKSFWKILGTNVGLFLLGLVVGVPLFKFITAILEAVPVLGVLVVFSGGILLITIWSLYYPARFIEDYGFFESFGRSQRLVRGRFWGTFGFLVVWWLLLMAVVFFLYIPSILLEGEIPMYLGIYDGSELFIILAGISSLLSGCISQLLYVLPMTGLIIYYYNQVERTEYPMLEESLYKIGQTDEAVDGEQASIESEGERASTNDDYDEQG